MEDYISSSLSAGLIRRSRSQVAAGIFFVKKKDGSLRLCVDYWQLNAISVKDRDGGQRPVFIGNSSAASARWLRLFTTPE